MRGSIVTWRSLPVIAVLILATACSVTDYKQPVSDFATATRDAETALVALNDEVTEAYTEKLRDLALSDDAIIQARSGDCLVTSERCQLEVVRADGAREVFPPDPLLGNMVTLMRSIAAYAEGLGQIVEADTAEQVATQVNATLGSVENLAETVEKLGGTGAAAGVAEYKTTVGKAVNWLVGQYVAKVQVDGLKRATGHAQPVIGRAADLFEASAGIAADIPKEGMANAVDKSVDDFDDNGREADLTTLLTASGDYDRYLLAKPSAVFAQLKEAHDALANRLHDDSLSLAEAMAKIETFAADAKALLEIVREFRTAGET